jgi:arylsulfate sulfotransferase
MWRLLVLFFLPALLGLAGGCNGVEASGTEAQARDRLRGGNSLFAAQPTVRGNPIERAPLIAIIEFESTTDVEAVVEITDGQREWEQPWEAGPTRQHSIVVMGLRPDGQHILRVRVQTPDAKEVQFSDPLVFQTPPLPDSFPPLKTTVANPSKMEPGVTLFAVNLWSESVSMLDYGYIVAVDQTGEVVWFCNTGDRIADMRVLENGHILYQHGSYRYAYEIDLLGRDHRRWVATNLTYPPDEESIGVEVDTMHHDLFEIPNGNLMTITTELRRFEEYPTSEFDPDAPWAPAYVVCDRVIEFEPTTGDIKDQLHLTNLLDRRRFGYMALSNFWKDKYDHLIDNGEQARDWSHANGLLYLPEENAIIVSFRHLDCIMKIDWKTKRIRWILGNPDGWGKAWRKYLLRPVGEVEWTYHQHSPQITPRGTLMVYDNGNYRARPFRKATLAPDNQSRVVEFKIDEQAMTVEQVYEFRGVDGDHFYCPFYCEADWLPRTGNILVTDGGHIELADGTPDDNVPAERQWARIFEITRGAAPEKVFELTCDSGLGSSFGWSIYRANRLPNLYDGFTLLPPEEGESGDLFPREKHKSREQPLNASF